MILMRFDHDHGHVGILETDPNLGLVVHFVFVVLAFICTSIINPQRRPSVFSLHLILWRYV